MNNNDWVKMLMFTHETLHEKLTTGKAVIIYGAGYNGIAALIKLKEYGIPVLCLCDADTEKQGRALSGIPIVSPEALREYPRETAVLISPEKRIAGIRRVLLDMGFRNLLYCSWSGLAFEKESTIREVLLAEAAENLEEANRTKAEYVRARLCDEKSKEIFDAVLDANFRSAYERLDAYAEEDQYFPEDIVKLRENEVFADCGACNGDTAVEFARRVPAYAYIYAFEPEPLQFELTKTLLALKKIKNCKVFNLGLSHSAQRLRFVSDGGGCSKICDSGELEVCVNSLDNVLLNEAHRPTYIKMDIEGAELNALKGARKIMERDHPRLAISVYHKPEDIWEIPHHILTAHPGYKLYLRQHQVFTETVCYGIWEGVH